MTNSTTKDSLFADKVSNLEAKFAKLEQCQKNVNELQYELGILSYNYGNVRKAEYYLKLATDQDFLPARFKLGILYKEMGAEEQAEYYFQAIASKEDSDLIFKIGTLYKEWGDKERAEHYFKRAAHERDPEIQFELGLLYKEWHDIKQAEQHLKIAADQDHHYAQTKLARLYLSNELKNTDKAVYYLELASDGGNAAGQYDLAEYYFDLGNKEQAEQYYKLAAIQQTNQQIFKVLEYGMDPVEFAQAALCGEYNYYEYC